MGGKSKTTQTTDQTTDTNPWAPAIGPINDIIGQIRGQIPNTALTGVEQGALDTLAANAATGNIYAPQIGQLATDLLSGGPDFSGGINAAHDELRANLLPFASGANLNPANNPYYQVVSNDIANRVNSMFAGSGRDLSGAHLQTLSRGITEGVAPLYEAERARQMGAISDLYNAGIGSTGILSNLSQTSLGNRQAGVGAATAALQARDAGANQQLAVEAMRRGLPIDNIAGVENLLLPIAQLGGTSKTHGVTTSESEQPLGQQILGGAIGGIGALGKMGAFGPTGWLLGGTGSLLGGLGAGAAGGASALTSMLPFLALSDERAKEDVQEIGELYDGSPVYSFRYIGDPKVHVGLMAQDVERRRPDAVVEVGGLKMVDYGKATEAAGILGGLR